MVSAVPLGRRGMGEGPGGTQPNRVWPLVRERVVRHLDWQEVVNLGDPWAYGGTSDTLTLEPLRENETSADRQPAIEEYVEAQGRRRLANDKRYMGRDAHREPDGSPGSAVRRLWGPPAGRAEKVLAGRCPGE